MIPSMICKKYCLVLAFSLVGLFLIWPAQAQETQDYYYQKIKVDITVNSDSTFDVVEEQIYRLTGSFGYFFREIELKDLDHLSGLEAYDSAGQLISEEELETAYSGNRKKIQWNFDRRIFNNELKSWIVQYKVYGGLRFFEKYDELYWNAVFEDRDEPVVYAEAIVHLPAPVLKQDLQQKLFIGQGGSRLESSNWQIIDEQTIKFWGYNLEPGEFLTLAIGWPKGLVQKPFLYRNQIINLVAVLLALGLLLFNLGYMIKKWLATGRDPKMRKTIIAQYQPPKGISPAVTGLLTNQSADLKDITAAIVDLAVKGYLRIREVDKSFFTGQEYIFEKLKDEAGLDQYQQKIMRGIFTATNQMKPMEVFKQMRKIIKQHKEIKKLHKADRAEAISEAIEKWQEEANLSQPLKIVSSKDLRNKFYLRIPGIQKAIYQAAEQTGYFNGNIQKIRQRYQARYLVMLILGMAMFIVGMALFGNFGSLLIGAVVLGVSLILSGVIGLIFAYYMPALTPAGVEAKWQILGFKEYLHTAERFRIGAETLETFSKYLPYAIILGVEKQWAKRFDDFSFSQKQMGWYVYAGGSGRTSGGAVISMGNFASSFSGFASSVSSALGSSPGGSGVGGGGGAGGGGGGGGGGAG
jgi:uncharacterized membrane protein YgcG